MIYALREALRDRARGGARGALGAPRRRAHEALRDALAVLGFERLAPEGEQLHPLLAVRVPEGIDEAAVRGALLRRARHRDRRRRSARSPGRCGGSA